MPGFVCSEHLQQTPPAQPAAGAEPRWGAAHGVGGGLAPAWGFLCLSLTSCDRGEFFFSQRAIFQGRSCALQVCPLHPARCLCTRASFTHHHRADLSPVPPKSSSPSTGRFAECSLCCAEELRDEWEVRQGGAGALPVMPPGWGDHPGEGLRRYGGVSPPCLLLQPKFLAGSSCKRAKFTFQAAEAPRRLVLASQHPSEGTWLQHQWYPR